MVSERMDGAEDWRVLEGGLTAWFEAPSLSASAALAGRIAELLRAGETLGGSEHGRDSSYPRKPTGHHALPDLDLRVSGVRVRIGVQDSPGATQHPPGRVEGSPGPAQDSPERIQSSPDLTSADVVFAREISAAARDLGLTADPAALQTMRLAIDTADGPSVRPFWLAAFGYEPAGDGLMDPSRRDPAISYHRLDRPRPLRNRLHVDVVRVPEAVEAVKADVGEGYGPWGCRRADAEGNEIDLVPGDELSKRTADWRTVFSAMDFYPTESPAQASRLAAAVAALTDDAGWPLLIDLRPDGVTIDSGKDQWESDPESFAALANRIQTAAHDLALTADPSRLRFVQFCIDAVDVPAVRAFWTSVLGYHHDPRTGLTDIYDPRRLNPVLMFQEMDAADEQRRRQRNRLHLDLVIPPDQIQARLTTALTAGGNLLPTKTSTRLTVADPEGNELNLITDASSGIP